MNRRWFLVASLCAAVAWRSTFAAPKANARVGYLDLASDSDGELLYREFVEAMQRHGFVERRNLRIERRSADGRRERLRSLAAELNVAKLDVIVATSTDAALNAKFAAPHTPIVFVVSGDPVLEGLVKSLSRPQGKLTGVTTRGEDLSAKRLEILKEAFPRLRTVAVVGSTLSVARASFDEAARQLQLAVLRFPAHDLDEYRDTAAKISRSVADAILVVEDADAIVGLRSIVLLMMITRRPVMFNADIFVENGGLMAFGVNLRQRYRRVAELVVRILEGARPADIPVEQPVSYELVVNRRAAEINGITLPDQLLLRADRVIK